MFKLKILFTKYDLVGNNTKSSFDFSRKSWAARVYDPNPHVFVSCRRRICLDSKFVSRGLAREILTSQADSLEGDPLKFLRVSEGFWKSVREGSGKAAEAPQVVRRSKGARLQTDGQYDYDVLVCGGTLGVFLALALQQRGHRVCIVERRLLQGRTQVRPLTFARLWPPTAVKESCLPQEWNISRHELMGLAAAGLLTEAELESCIVSEFNPVRSGFFDASRPGPQGDLWVNDCLNLGVCPRSLIQVWQAGRGIRGSRRSSRFSWPGRRLHCPNAGSWRPASPPAAASVQVRGAGRRGPGEHFVPVGRGPGRRRQGSGWDVTGGVPAPFRRRLGQTGLTRVPFLLPGGLTSGSLAFSWERRS